MKANHKIEENRLYSGSGLSLIRSEQSAVKDIKKATSINEIVGMNSGKVELDFGVSATGFCKELCDLIGIPGQENEFMKVVAAEKNDISAIKFKVVERDFDGNQPKIVGSAKLNDMRSYLVSRRNRVKTRYSKEKGIGLKNESNTRRPSVR